MDPLSSLLDYLIGFFFAEVKLQEAVD